MAQAKQKPPADPSEAQSLDDFLCFAIYSANLAVNRLNKPVLDQLGLDVPAIHRAGRTVRAGRPDRRRPR